MRVLPTTSARVRRERRRPVGNRLLHAHVRRFTACFLVRLARLLAQTYSLAFITAGVLAAIGFFVMGFAPTANRVRPGLTL
jgi:hypothetical protein